MKKMICVNIIFLLCALCLSGCNEDAVKSLINLATPDTVATLSTAPDATTITQAEQGNNNTTTVEATTSSNDVKSSSSGSSKINVSSKASESNKSQNSSNGAASSSTNNNSSSVVNNKNGTSSATSSSSTNSSSQNKNYSLSLSKKSITLDIGDTTTIKATTNSSNTIMWWSSDKRIASLVEKNGSIVIKALSAGTVTITAECNGNKATCSVKVNEEEIPAEYKAYVKPYDINKIKNDMVAYGKSLGFVYDSTLMPGGAVETDNPGGWDSPLGTETFSKNYADALSLKRNCLECIDSLYGSTIYEGYKPSDTRFNVYFKATGNGDYDIYVPYG